MASPLGERAGEVRIWLYQSKRSQAYKKMLKKIKAHYHKHKLKRAQKREERRRNLEIIKNYPSAYDDAILSWKAPEHVIHQRGVLWKILAILVTLGAASLAIFYESWTFALAILVFAFTYSLIHFKNKTRIINIKLSEIGIKVGTKKYPYTSIRAFWFIYDPPYLETLHLKITEGIIGEFTIQLNGQNPGHIREFLITKIPELEGQSESLSEIFLRLFKL